MEIRIWQVSLETRAIRLTRSPGGAWGGGGGVTLTQDCATHPCPPTSKMDPKWRIAPCYIYTLKYGVTPATQP